MVQLNNPHYTARHVARIRKWHVNKKYCRKTEMKRPLERPRRRRNNTCTIKVNITEIGYSDWIQPAQGFGPVAACSEQDN
jgi:hypothetical protein